MRNQSCLTKSEYKKATIERFLAVVLHLPNFRPFAEKLLIMKNDKSI